MFSLGQVKKAFLWFPVTLVYITICRRAHACLPGPHLDGVRVVDETGEGPALDMSAVVSHRDGPLAGFVRLEGGRVSAFRSLRHRAAQDTTTRRTGLHTNFARICSFRVDLYKKINSYNKFQDKDE